MAMLRNLRNFLEFDISMDALSVVANHLSDEREVVHSKQFPFRYLSAYREVKKVGCRPNIQAGALGKAGVWERQIPSQLKALENPTLLERQKHLLLDALEKAVLATSQNIAGFDEHTRVVLACDVSGSMYSSISQNSTVKNFDIGLVLAMLLKHRCANVISGIFGSEWKAVNLPSTGILNTVGLMYKREGEVGYATNGYKVIAYLNNLHIVTDKVMMFTDCQMWNSNGNGETIRREWDKYKQIAPDAKLYLFDLSGYGTAPLQIVRDDVALISGWSDRIFDMLNAIENGSNALAEIKKIEI